MKVMSKMGISTYQSYCGAQIFDAVGLSTRVRRASTSPAPRPRSKASAWHEIAEEAVRRHARRLRRQPDLPRHARCRRRLRLPPARRGPCLDAGQRRQAAARGARQLARRATRPSPRRSTSRAERLLTIRGLMEFKPAEHAGAARGGRAGRARSSSASPPAR